MTNFANIKLIINGMENILMLKERVDYAVQMGESHYREFKSGYEGPRGNKKARDFKDICRQVAKELVAFANADGGELFVGIEDNGEVTGLPHSDKDIKAIIEASKRYVMKDTPLPIKRQNIIDIDGKKVIHFSVDKGTKYIHQTSKGEAFKREDKDSVPTSINKIMLPRDEEQSRKYDREFEHLASMEDLDMQLLTNVAQKSVNIKNISPEKFLQSMELAEFDGDRLRLRKAVLLLFSKNINKWHPRSRIRILKVEGKEQRPAPDYNVTEAGDISGNIFELSNKCLEVLLPAITKTKYTDEGRFETRPIYPETALEEALLNAIVHRDYSIEGRGIEIRIFDDRLEILSPGRLLSLLTIADLENLKGVHETRNIYIARVLRESGYIRELGEGIIRIFDAVKERQLINPKISSPNNTFIITFFNEPIFKPSEKLSKQEVSALREAIRNTQNREGSLYNDSVPLSLLRKKLLKTQVSLNIFDASELTLFLNTLNENTRFIYNYEYPGDEFYATSQRNAILTPLLKIREKIMTELGKHR